MSEEAYFDDCPLCQLMKKAEEEGRAPTPEEIRAATFLARDRGAVVGGPLVDEPESGE